MRSLLATTCLTPIALSLAVPAAAQTVISGTRSTYVDTSTVNNGAADDVVISETGMLEHAAGPYTAIEVTSSNNVTNNGSIVITNGDASEGIAGASFTGNIVNNGYILLAPNSFRNNDTDGDGDGDGPFVNSQYQEGIDVGSAQVSITNTSRGQIGVYGNLSSGIRWSAITGDVTNDGSIFAEGTSATAVNGQNLTGSVRIGGTVSAVGDGAVGTSLIGVTGSVTLSGKISATGYRYPSTGSLPSGASIANLDADDLLQGGSAVVIGSYIDGGVNATGIITSYGSAPALRIGAGISPTILGAGPGGFGLSIDGTVTGNAVYTNVSATGVQISDPGQGVTLANGVSINGTVSATSLNVKATGLSIEGATAPLIQVGGTVKATAGTSAKAATLAVAIEMSNAAVDTIRNSGDVEAVTGDGGGAVAIIDENGSTLQTIINSGAIKATTTGNGLTAAIYSGSGNLKSIANTGLISAVGASDPRSNYAIYANGGGLTIDQNAAATGAPAPAIIGDIVLTADDTINLNAGSLTGNVYFTAGKNRFTASGDATASGNITFGNGIDTVALTGTSVVNGRLDMGAGDNNVTLQGQSTLIGAVAFGDGQDELALVGGAKMTGDVAFGEGSSNSLLVSGGSLTGAVTFGTGNDQVMIGQSSILTGQVSFGEGSNHLSMQEQGKLAGNVTFGAGDDRIDLVGTSVLAGDVLFGDGKNALTLKGATALKGNSTFGAGDDAVGLGDTSSITGNLALGGGANDVMLAGASTIKGDVTYGDGNNRLLTADMATVAGNVQFGDGKNDLILTLASSLTGNATFGNGANVANLNGTASMKGDVLFGGGANALVLGGTSKMTGNATFGDGDNAVRLIEGSALAGNVTFGKGSDAVTLSGTSTLTGKIALGEGANNLTASDTSVLKGDVSSGAGNDTLQLKSGATLIGNVALGGGGNIMSVSDNAALTGNVTTGSGLDSLVLINAAKLTGNVDLGDGNDILQLGQTAVLTGNASLGAGNDTLTIGDTASLTGNVNFGTGSDGMTMTGAAVYAGTADFGGDGTDTLALNGTSRFAGTLANSQKLAVVVNGGTLAVAGTGTTTIGSLTVASGGTLGVTIDAVANAATRYAVLGNASFAAGSKLAINLKGTIANEATYTILTAGTITGAANLTPSQLSLPFLFKASLVNAPATEIAVHVARKTASEIGLNRSGASAYDAIFAALAKDTKVQSAVFAINDQAGIKRAIASMLPDHAGGTFEATTSGSRAMGRMLADADAPFADEGKWGFWIDGVAFNRTKSTGDTAGYDVKGTGTAGGAEIKTDGGNIGLSIAYLHGTDRITGAANSVSDDQYEGALYWRGSWGGLHAFARVSAAKIDFAGKRRFSGNTGSEVVNRTATANWGGTLYSSTGGASYEARFGRLSLRPIVSLDYYRLNEDAYTETGGGAAFDLKVASRSSDEFAGNATVAAGMTLGSRDKGWLRAEIEGGRRQVIAGSLGATTARFEGGQAFTLIPEDRTSGWVGRLHLTGGVKSFRLGADIGREQQQGRAATSVRATLQYGF